MMLNRNDDVDVLPPSWGPRLTLEEIKQRYAAEDASVPDRRTQEEDEEDWA